MIPMAILFPCPQVILKQMPDILLIFTSRIFCVVSLISGSGGVMFLGGPPEQSPPSTSLALLAAWARHPAWKTNGCPPLLGQSV